MQICIPQLMGFKDDKGKILEDLGTLNFDHQGRSGRTEEENLLAAGLLTPEEAIEIVKCTWELNMRTRPTTRWAIRLSGS